MFKRIILILAFLFLLLFISMIISTQNADGQNETEQRVKAVYGIDGRPINQTGETKGFHRVSASVKLVDGLATITLNTSTTDGQQNVSFISEDTYRGQVWVSDTSNTNTYGVYPQSGTQFIILSSSATDTVIVNYWVEGE